MRTIAISAGLLIVSAVCLAQESDPNTWVKVRTGYTAFQLSDIRDLMNSGVSWYNSMGVPVSMQTDFPGNALVGGEIEYHYKWVRMGAGVYKTNTMGFFGAQDVSGILKVRSNVHLLVVQALFGITLSEQGGVSWYAMLKPGYASGTWDLQENVSFNDFPRYNVANATDGYAKGFEIDAVLGLEIHVLRNVHAAGEMGYRKTGGPKITVGSSESELGFNASGLITSVSIGVGF